MEKNLNGIEVSKILYEELNDYLLKQTKIPTIVDISIGNDFGSLIYSKMKQKKISKETPIKFKNIHFETISYLDLKNLITQLNTEEEVTGIMLQLPLPANLKKYERDILDTIDKNKDIDGLTSISAGLLATAKDALIPSTALGIETLLKAYNISLEGKNIAIISRSNIVGKPLMHLMLRNNATPIICHSKTYNLPEITKKCDIVIAALNKQEYITSNYLKEGAILIDVGIHKNKQGQTVGDVKYKDVYDKVSLITPPIGAVGPMTICMLAYNATKSIYGQEVNKILNTGISKAKELLKQNISKTLY